jgi:hypothetical protein
MLIPATWRAAISQIENSGTGRRRSEGDEWQTRATHSHTDMTTPITPGYLQVPMRPDSGTSEEVVASPEAAGASNVAADQRRGAGRL